MKRTFCLLLALFSLNVLADQGSHECTLSLIRFATDINLSSLKVEPLNLDFKGSKTLEKEVSFEDAKITIKKYRWLGGESIQMRVDSNKDFWVADDITFDQTPEDIYLAVRYGNSEFEYVVDLACSENKTVQP